ncbi:MAG: ABC transporter ATP-binding protein [Candidatus Binatia bacterium]
MHAIDVEHVSKTYRIPHERQTTLLERLLSVFRPSKVDTLRALDDVTIHVPFGSFVGIIGANGSGKSTLLKLLAGVLVPDAGSVRVNGTLAPLLELGVGFHHELTVRENVTLYGSVLGYPRESLDERVAEVIAFAELERFRDAKLKSLSSGMVMRLAFATALRADSDILLLDEVLAVGDAQFQRKCFQIFEELRHTRKTIVLVSHDLVTVQRFCDRIFWLDRGRLVMAGEAQDVIQMYLAMSQALPSAGSPGQQFQAAANDRLGTGDVRFLSADLHDATGLSRSRIPTGTRAVLQLVAEVHRPVPHPVYGIIVRQGAQIVYSANTVVLGVAVDPLAPGDRVEVSVPFTAALANGQYIIDVAVASRSDSHVYDWVNNALTFVVEGSVSLEGVADLAAAVELRLQRPAPAPQPTPSSGT